MTKKRLISKPFSILSLLLSMVYYFMFNAIKISRAHRIIFHYY